MLKIQRSSNGEVVFTLNGQMDEEQAVELEALIKSEAKGRRIVLDLKDLTLVSRDVLSFLDGKLELPPSREYLAQEIENIVNGCGLIWETIWIFTPMRRVPTS